MDKVKNSFVAMASDSDVSGGKMGVEKSGKINGLLERVTHYMPQYYKPPQNWKGRGGATIEYCPKWRNFPVIRNSALWVGQKIGFRLKFDQRGPDGPIVTHVVHEVINGLINSSTSITEKETNVSGLLITGEGDYKFVLGFPGYFNPDAPVLFSAHIQNKDRRWIFWTEIILTSIATFITTVAAGIVLAFISIKNPAWVIWIPEPIMEILRRIFQ